MPCKGAPGAVFGALTTVRKVGVRDTHSVWECVCLCGASVSYPWSELVRKGALARCPSCSRSARAAHPAHRFAKVTWTCMNVRCGNGRYRIDNSKNRSYGSVLIRFTRAEYYEWCRQNVADIISKRRPSIDRIDPDGDYSLDNIRVLELSENSKRRRTRGRVAAQEGAGEWMSS